MSQTELNVPENITFEGAIALTQNLIPKIESETINATQIQSLVSDLVATSNGARGFFVTYLTADSPVADQPPKAVLEGLKTSPELVSELLVKNVAMSTAMAITHRRQDHESMAQGSDRVQRRSIDLIKQLNHELLQEKAQQMRDSALTGKGEAEVAFFERWGYDQEQRSAIAQQLAAVIKN
ncbi:hypothetical protein PCC7418_1486 [Halothece sp. PCC 7418]|uniref:hypothetical protein n=1 Tax=Halothece sp. (strain PCC 7418) TaxID=65093 RepID=UPI0002A08A39|nr:hypothetical protein [Halothece sp. PCC 7418]AFZ43675.1 hypothetical protein PCC7418_1486 [Halothece sp. PCC 7418]